MKYYVIVYTLESLKCLGPYGFLYVKVLSVLKWISNTHVNGNMITKSKILNVQCVLFHKKKI